MYRDIIGFKRIYLPSLQQHHTAKLGFNHLVTSLVSPTEHGKISIQQICVTMPTSFVTAKPDN
jgi:hypothetical protein